MTRFNNNNNDNNESSCSTRATTMVTTDVASSSSSSSSSSTTNAAVTMATQSSSTTTATATTMQTKTSTTMIEKPTVSFVGQPCGHHGSYTFYKAFKYCSKPNELDRVLMLGEFFFVRISPHDDPCIGELQLLWEDHQNHQLLSSTRLYFLPEQTPEGRLSHHGQHEVLAAQDKVILKLTDLVTWITHQVDWIAGMQYKWQPSTSSCPSSTSDDPLLLSTTTSSSTTSAAKLNEEDNVAVKDGGEKENSSEKQPTQWLQQRNKLSSLAFIHNQNVIPPNGSVPFLTSQRFISDKCRILFNSPTTSPTTTTTAEQNIGPTTTNDHKNIDETSSASSSWSATTDQPPPRQQPQRYCRSFTCSRVDFSDIIPLKLESNQLQDDLSNVVVLSYDRYCRYRNLLKRIEGKEEDYLARQTIIQDALTELGIPQQRSGHVNILFCRDTFNHEALLNNDLNCEHLAPKLKGRPRKRPLKTVRASSPDSDSPEENGRLFSPRRTRRTTAASTLASNLLNQSLFDKRKMKQKKATSNKTKRSNAKNNTDQYDNNNKNSEDGGGGLVMVEFNDNKNPNDNDHQNHHEDGQKMMDKENKPSNTNNTDNGGNMNNHHSNNGGRNDDDGGQHCDNGAAEGDDKNKMDSTVDANNNIDKCKEQEEGMIIVVDRKDATAGGDCDPGCQDGGGDNIDFNSETFLKELMEFMRKRRTPIQRVPNLGFKKIDLYLFYIQAKKYGGYEQLTKKRLWKKLYDDMGGDKKSTSKATCTRRHYEKLLLPFERHLNGLPDQIRKRRKKKSSDDFVEESDDVLNGVEDESSSNFSETDTNSTNNDSDGKPSVMVVVDPEVILKRTATASPNNTVIKGIQLSKSLPLSECDEMNVKMGNNNVNHLDEIRGNSTPTDQEIDIKLIPIDSNNDECLRKEKELKLFRDISTTTTTARRPSTTVSPNENILISVSEDKPQQTKKDDDGQIHHQPIKRIKLNNDVGGGGGGDDLEQCLMLAASSKPGHHNHANSPQTINQTLLNNNKTTITTVVPFSSSTNSHQKMTALVHPTQRRILNNDAGRDVYGFSDLNTSEQQKEELLLVKSFESSNKKQQQQQSNMNPDHKSRSKGPSPFHSIANLVNNNDRGAVLVHSPETIEQAEKTTGTTRSSINSNIYNNNPILPATISANVKKNILQKSLESLSHHQHQHHQPTGLPSPAHSNLSAAIDGFKQQKFNIQPDEILDLSVKKRFHEADSGTTLNVKSFPVKQHGLFAQQPNTVCDGILLDLSKNNKLNSTTKQPAKLPATSKLHHPAFVQENHPCSTTTMEPANLNGKRNLNLPPKDVGKPSIISSRSDEMIVRAVDAPHKVRPHKISPKQIKAKHGNSKTSSVIQPNPSMPSSSPQKPSISEYNPLLPQFIGSHWLNPFQMPFAGGVVPPPTFTSAVHHHSPPKSTPPQLSFNTVQHSNIPAITSQSILSSFPNYDTRSSSSSSSTTITNSSSLDRNSLALFEQLRMIQAYQLKNDLIHAHPFLNPDILANYNPANMLASTISSSSK